jgi:parvulin-like peptidyl-prolyl isomerase
MSRATDHILLLALAIVLALASAGCAGSGPVVAQVGDNAISQALLVHWQSVDAIAHRKPPGDPATSMRKALGFLISSRWLAGEAEELGIKVSDGQAQQQLEVLRYVQREHLPFQKLPKEPQLRSYLLSSEVSMPDRLWLMRLTMLAAQLEQRRYSHALTEITSAQIARYYAHHQRRFWEPERRNLEVLGNQKLGVVIKAKHEIEAGKSFLSLARRVSEDQEAPGGIEHPLARGEEEPEYDRVVFSAKPHVLVGPISQTFYFIFEVLKITPAHERPLARAQGTIRGLLAQQRASTVLAGASERKWSARTSCHPRYVVSGCGVRKAA